MRLSGLMESVNGSYGYNGGPVIDTLPHLSLTEATGMLPIVIMESQMDFLNDRRKQTSLMVEAAIGATASDYNRTFSNLVEGAFDTLKAKIKAFFDKIIKWIKSIIAKLKIAIDKIRMSGHQLWEKYKSKLGSDSDYKDVTVDGFKEEKGRDLATKLMTAMSNDTEAVIKEGMKKAGYSGDVMLPNVFATKIDNLPVPKDGEDISDDVRDQMKEDISAITDISAEDRDAGIASQLIGEDMSKGNWSSDLQNLLYGDKSEIKYGTDMFTRAGLAKYLDKCDPLEAVKKNYETALTKTEKYKNTIEKELEKTVKPYENDTSGASYIATVKGLINEYYSAYIGLVTATYNVTMKCRDILVNYYKIMAGQAKTMLGKLISHKGPKKNNSDASDWDVIGAMDFDF